MSTSTTSTATDAPAAGGRRTPFRTANKVGLVLAGVLGAIDVVSVFGPPTAPGEPGPPMAILALDSALGVVTVLAVIIAFRSRRRGWVRLAAGARVLSMITALPAFFAGVPAWLVAIVAVFVVVTVVTVVLMLLPTRAPAA